MSLVLGRLLQAPTPAHFVRSADSSFTADIGPCDSLLTDNAGWPQAELLASKTKAQNAVAELEALVTQLGNAAAEEASQAVTAAVEAEKAEHAKALEELQAAKVHSFSQTVRAI